MIRILIFAVVVSATTSGCKAQKKIPATPAEKQAVWAKVIDYSEIAGCTYLLELSDGQKLQPVNLQEEYRRAGLKLFITYKVFDGVSVCMTGKMVTLTSVSMAKEDGR